MRSNYTLLGDGERVDLGSGAGADYVLPPKDAEIDDSGESENGNLYESETEDETEFDQELAERIQTVLASCNRPYDPLFERTPKLPAYHPSFAKVERIYTEIIEEAIYLLKYTSYKDKQTETLLEHFSARREIKYPKAKKIGMLGDSGVGKSSLINMLLDTPELANEGSSGGACTCVPTEYHQAWSHQSSPFMAEVVFFEPTTMQGIIEEHFKDYFQHYHESMEELDDATKEESEHRASTAVEAFRAMFCDRKEFATDEAATAFLSLAKSADDTILLAQLYSWTKQLLSSEKVTDGLATRCADTAEELGGYLERFVKTVSVPEGEPAVHSAWPLVQIVRIGLQSRLLERGLIIADLPGLSDVNRTRTRVTERYIRDCFYMILVAPIGRVATDNLVQRRLVKGFKTHGSRKALACTHTDVIPRNMDPKDLVPTSEAHEDYKAICKALKSTYVRMEKARLSLKKLKGVARKESARLTKKLIHRTKALTALKFESLVKMRNTKVTNLMRKKYRDITSDPKSLDVSCISNNQYSQHLEGYDEELIPMSLETTGIPTLRMMLSRIPAESKLNILRQHRSGVLPDMISSLEMWSSKSATKLHNELRLITAKPREGAEDHITRFLEEIKSKVSEIIIGKIRKSEPQWIQQTSKTVEKWMRWHPSTIKAWCCHDGSYCTKKQEQVSWNSELLEPVNKDLGKAWEAFDQALKEEKEDCLNMLMASVDNIRQDLKEIPGVGQTDMTPFLASLNSKKVLLSRCMHDAWEELAETSRNTRLEAILDGQDSYLMQAMLPLYKRTGALFGKNSGVSRKTLIVDAINKGEPFSKIRIGVRKSFYDEIKNLQPKIVSAVHQVFDHILSDFDNMFVVKEINDPLMNELREQIKDFVVKANRQIHGKMDTELAKAMGCDPDAAEWLWK